MGKNYTDLMVWQKAMDLVVAIYSATRTLPKEEMFGLISQMRRAAVSVPSNIAEGQARKTRGEFKHFLGMAHGSLAELGTQATVTERLEMLPAEVAKELSDQITQVARMLNALLTSLESTGS